jgi:hypothetical protein
VDALSKLSRKDAEIKMQALDEEATRLLGEVDRYAELVVKANEPTILPSSDFETLTELSEKKYKDPKGEEKPYLSADEVKLLSIPRGSLDPDERRQIESHVTNSFNFLTQIPWTPEFRRIPEIAQAHHEKLNGRGYPNGLTSADIPVQAKIMTICDIYDALSASDRPYKRAIPTDRAMEILKVCVRDEEIDEELFRVFQDAQVFRVTEKAKKN